MKLSKKNGPKVDSKVRFQSREFSGRLNDARQFRRHTVPVHDNRILRVLQVIGLGAWYTQLVVGFVLALVIVWLYMPFVFKITKISIEVPNQDKQVFIEKTVQDFLNSRGFLGVPQNNLFLISKPALEKYLLSKDQSIRVNIRINRKLPSTLLVNVDFRKEKFLVTDGKSVLLYYDDGNESRKLSDNVAQFFDDQSTDRVKIWWQGPINDISNDIFAKIDRIISAFHPPTDSSIDFVVAGQLQTPNAQSGQIELQPHDPRVDQIHEEITSPGLVVYTKWQDNQSADKVQKGYKIYLDVSADIEELLARIEVLLAKRSVDSQRKLYYIDMRYEGRAYLCDVGAVCSQPTAPKVLVEPGTETKERLDTAPPILQPKPRGE